MTLNEEQLNALSRAALPLMIWLSNNCHPHVTVIVDSGRAELLEGLATAIYSPDAPQPLEEPVADGLVVADDQTVESALV
jgi:hypothetical protein